MQSKKAKVEEREYGKNPLTESELREIIGDSPVTEFLNSRNSLYQERNMKQKPPSKEEAIKLILKEPNLLKRPVVIKGKKTIFGFDETELRGLL